MCGIGLIAAGVPIVGEVRSSPSEICDSPGVCIGGELDDLLVAAGSRLPSVCSQSQPAGGQGAGGLRPTFEDLCRCLVSRGPDQIGVETVLLTRNEQGSEGLVSAGDAYVPSLQFVGSSLQLRGDQPVAQPFKDVGRNILAYNGEIYDGLPVGDDENDGAALLAALHGCCCCSVQSRNEDGASCSCETSVPRLLSSIRGPWALIYWQARSWTLWFGRDAIGRRSLLVHWPSSSDARLLLSSVAPAQMEGLPKNGTGYSPAVSPSCASDFWVELPCGLYSISLKVPESRNLGRSELDASQTISFQTEVYGVLRLHQWQDPLLRKLVAWERQQVSPVPRVGTELELHDEVVDKDSSLSAAAHKVLKCLHRAVQLRTTKIMDLKVVQDRWGVLVQPRLSLLFSGGLDSMILAALADQSLPLHLGIDLLNVSFEGATAPDRITAVAGLAELQVISPKRRWILVEIDADMEKVDRVRNQVLTLICPAQTHMDFNIGIALWLAASGQGFVIYNSKDGESCWTTLSRHAYESKARVLLVGAGADEQCAGYGRHRTSFKLGGWTALQAEMQVDVQRIWKRNLGRDDRCIGDNGKEARFPFLDEEVIETLLDLPLSDIADLTKPQGQGDKRILREVASLLGIKGASSLPKRAIQFGSRIARESNKREFGSNRAANLASAGSAPYSGDRGSSTW